MVQTKKRTTMRALKKSRNTKKTRGTRYNKRKHNRKPMGKKRRTRRTNKRMRGGSSINLLTSVGTSAGATTVGIVSGQTNDVSPNVYNQPIVSPIIGFV
jgi:hypothetical protein